MKFDNCIEKTCCIYASEWHLAVMLLPFISKSLKENSNICMKFEESIEDKIEQLLSKLELKNKAEIKKINWNLEVGEEETSENKKIYIVSGNDSYIEDMNNKIEKYYHNRKVKIQIVDCFHITDNTIQREISEKNSYKKVLTTKGEYEV